jgi:hypothetical protein
MLGLIQLIAWMLIMILRRPVLAVFISCLLLADAGAAYADARIVQCIDAAGAVTFTDAACHMAADAARASGAQAVSDRTEMPRTAKKALRAGQQRASRHKPLLVPDTSTVRAAKVSLLASDELSALARQQAAARRSARAESGWAFW